MLQLGSGSIWRVRVFDPETQGNEYFFLEGEAKKKLEEDLDKKNYVTIGGNLIKTSFVSGIQRVTHDDRFMHCIAELGENKKKFFQKINASEMDDARIQKSLYDFLLWLYFDRILNDEVYEYRPKEGVQIGQRTKEFINYFISSL